MASPPYFFRKSTSPCWYALLAVLSSILTACGDATARAEIESVSRVWEASLLAGQPSKAVSEVFTEDALRLPAGEESVSPRDFVGWWIRWMGRPTMSTV